VCMGLAGFAILVGCRPRNQQHSMLANSLQASIVMPRQIGGALVVGDTDLTGNRNIAGGFPRIVSQQIAASEDVYLSRQQFVVSFDSQAKVPAWTAWQIVKTDLGDVARSDDFRSDEILNTYLKTRPRVPGVSPQDYKNTCFDRGHQAPSADRTSLPRHNLATFYMSNMAPQTAFLNRRIWADFESYSRDLVRDDGRKLQVYAGTILRDGREGIGRNKDIQVPEAFYKVVAVYEDDDAKKPMGYIAVVMPNVTSNGKDPLAYREESCAEQKSGGSGTLSKSWRNYKVSLKELERRAGISFPNLDQTRAL
jgi:endonuclease G, mitochondrial